MLACEDRWGSRGTSAEGVGSSTLNERLWGGGGIRAKAGEETRFFGFCKGVGVGMRALQRGEGGRREDRDELTCSAGLAGNGPTGPLRSDGQS